jgi:valyl-tRNA synthetase
MPFSTEEIYHRLKERKEGDDLTVKRITDVSPDSYRDQKSEVLKQGELLKEVITAIRDTRNKNQLKPKDQIRLHLQTEEKPVYKRIESIIQKQLNTGSIGYVDTAVPGTINVVVGKDKFFIATENQTNTANQKEQLRKDLSYLEGFLSSVEKKLSNERFVQNAKPEVIETEKRKKADAEAKIKAIKESLATL